MGSTPAAIVGRRGELDEIDRLLESAGSAAGLLLDGDAGIGKRRSGLQASTRRAGAIAHAVLTAPARAFTQAERSELIADARRIKAVIGC